MNKVAVIGLGYVGLPLAVATVNAGYKTVGIDSNVFKIKTLSNMKSPIEDISDQQILELFESKAFKVSSSYEDLSDVDVVLICVPTPLTSDRNPDLSYLIEATHSIATHVKAGALIILESTVAPGTTRNILAPILSTNTRLGYNRFDLAFSPERIDPGNRTWNLESTPKLIAGLTETAQIRAKNFYSKFVAHTVICDSLEIAETAKLLENSFRLLNISFINEISVFCEKLNIDLTKVIKAASTKPYGYMPFYPGIGIGGHCIPVDPIYLAHLADEIGSPLSMIELADRINQQMPRHFVERAKNLIGNLKGKRVLVIGVAYKPNISDVRESPAKSLILGLTESGAVVSWHDDLVKEWNGEKSVLLSDNFDLAIITTPHDHLDLSKLGSVPVLNTRSSI